MTAAEQTELELLRERDALRAALREILNESAGWASEPSPRSVLARVHEIARGAS